MVRDYVRLRVQDFLRMTVIFEGVREGFRKKVLSLQRLKKGVKRKGITHTLTLTRYMRTWERGGRG